MTNRVIRSKKSNISVSIVIPSYNSEKDITRCLDSLCRHTDRSSTEIIVVDSSKDMTAEIISKKFPHIKLFRQKKRTMPGEARNIGVSHASGEVIAFTDSDCEVDGNWPDNGITKLEEGFQIIGGPVQNGGSGKFINKADHLLSFRDYLPGGSEREVNFIPSCNLIIRKIDFNRIGGFNENFLSGEDVLFCNEAIKRNMKLLSYPDLRILHHNRKKFKDYLTHQYNLGKYLSMARKYIGTHNTLFHKIKPLVIFIPFIKLIRTYLKILIKHPGKLPELLLLSPLIIPGIMTWSMGYAGPILNNK